MLVTPETIKPINRPAFIAFEGINGCGKTTLHRAISERLRAEGRTVIDTREPGGTPLGKEIRKLLLEWDGEQKSDLAELLLFAADRAEHVNKVIAPSLASGSWVLCDRYIYSTLAFQGHGRRIKRQWLEQANQLATQGLIPDLVILLDLEPRVALSRIATRADNGRDNFEGEELSFHTRIRDGFIELANTSSAPFLKLDATLAPAQLAQLAAAGIARLAVA
jgi:dTMP kinase